LQRACVGRVAREDYDESVRRASLFLSGRSDELARELASTMGQASERLDFEQAARLRDLLAAVRSVQSRQYVDGQAADMDVLACAMRGASACVLLLAFRDGRNLGTRAFFRTAKAADEVLSAFVSQYYAEQTPPAEIVLDREIPDAAMLAEALSTEQGRKVVLKWNVRGERAGYVDLARRRTSRCSPN
jgi:excinuclease ABC subunit C